MYDLKPLRKPHGLPVLQAIQGVSLTSAAAEIMAANAEVVSEGVVEQSENRDPVYRGSTLVSIDMDKPCFDIQKDADTLHRFLGAAERSLTLHIRLVRLSRMEAERRAAPLFVREMRAETSFRMVDKCLLVDIDIECPLAVAMDNPNDAKAGGR